MKHQAYRILLTGTIAGEGGIQYHMRQFIRALDQSGHHVCCLSAHPHHQKTDAADLKSYLHYGPSERVQLENISGFSNAQKAKAYRQTLKKFQPDILITIGHGFGNLLLAMLTPNRIPRVYFEVMVTEQKLPVTNPRRHYHRLFSHFVAQSHSVGLKLQHEMNKKVEFTSIHAMPQINEEDARIPQATERQYEQGQLKACYFGRLIDYKRPQLLAKYFPKVADQVLEYHVYGTGPEKETIEAYARDHQMENRIICHGRYPAGEEYYALLDRHDFLVLPTIGSEGSPLVLLESMACGVPYLSCDTGGIKDYEFPENHCQVVGKSEDEFLAGVKRMSENLIGGKINRSSLQAVYQEKYSFEACKANWLAEIDRIIKNHR